MVKVSVVIPVYNVELYLSKCIDSVLSQTLIDIEVLLVNDGSTDNSLAICQKYARLDDRICVLEKINGGLPSARNYGMDYAKGKYIIFLDSDDYWLDNEALERLVQIAESSNVDIVRGACLEFLDGDNCAKPLAFTSKGNYPILSNELLLEEAQSHGFFIWLYLFRFESIKDLRFDNEQKFQEDIEFSIRLFLKDLKGVVVPFYFYAYRKRKESLTTSVNIKHLFYSFLLSRKFGEYSSLTQSDHLKSLYLRSAVQIYNSTLETMVSDMYYQMNEHLIEEFHLDDLQLNVKKWAKDIKCSFYPMTTYCKPRTGARLLRLYVVIRSFVLLCGSKCKHYILCQRKNK